MCRPYSRPCGIFVKNVGFSGDFDFSFFSGFTMHALRLLALGIVFGLLLVGIAAKQKQESYNNLAIRYRTSLGHNFHQSTGRREQPRVISRRLWPKRHNFRKGTK